MSTNVTAQSEIPDAPYYVLSNDTFMSGWGLAKGKTNTLIFPCETREEAETVRENALYRTDQKRVRVLVRKPQLRTSRVYYSLTDREEAEAWYTPGAWKDYE